MPIVFSLSWLWYIATSALRFGRPLVLFVGVGAAVDDTTFATAVGTAAAAAAAAAEYALSLFDRPADFLFDSFKAIAKDFGLPPPETGDFLVHVDDLGDTLD